jgi:hypothetical protein
MTEKSKENKAKFCKEGCPICKRARTRGGIARWFVKNIDSPVCPYCKAYEQVYGCLAYEQPSGNPEFK